MRQRSINVAIVGCGSIANSHVEAWRNVGAKIVAVCDINASIAKSKAKKWGVSHHYEDLREMIQKERLDVASICTPPIARLSIVEPLIKNGVHVVIEKPFAMSINEAEKMVKLKDEYGVKLTVVHNWLFSHIMKRVLQSLRRGEIGDLLGLQIIMLHTKDDPMASDSQHWCHSLKAGRFGENLPHPVYITRAILGKVKVRHISGSKLGSYPWMPIDELHVLLEDDIGRIALIYISFNSIRPETSLKIFGSRGVLEANLSNNILVKKSYREISNVGVFMDNLRFIKDTIVSSFSIGRALITKQYQGTHTEFIKDFVNSLENNIEPPVTAEEALEVLKLHMDLSSIIHKRYYIKHT
ncbi:TPA: Gfo/Idh/MocA family oxidoreductase [Candidatus Bathyarchaeota archaeon]|nr:Gfo/Idh/MocA family oxidoreductase [Candidatus Bathyarchaeota archaeon]